MSSVKSGSSFPFIGCNSASTTQWPADMLRMQPHIFSEGNTKAEILDTLSLSVFCVSELCLRSICLSLKMMSGMTAECGSVWTCSGEIAMHVRITKAQKAIDLCDQLLLIKDRGPVVTHSVQQFCFIFAFFLPFLFL